MLVEIVVVVVVVVVAVVVVVSAAMVRAAVVANYRDLGADAEHYCKRHLTTNRTVSDDSCYYY